MSFKLALVNPLIYDGRPISSASPPINLATLAGYIRLKIPSIKIKIIDGVVSKDIFKLTEEFKPDLIGITSTTTDILNAYKYADWCRQNIKCKVIMGGVHVSVMVDEALEHCDTVIIGDGELALLEIINKMINDEDITEKRIDIGIIKNIDEIPIPAYDLLDMEFYINKGNDKKEIMILNSRGCAYRCIFCHSSWRHIPPRYNSAKRVVDELEFLIRNYKLNYVFYTDDELLVNKPRFYKIIELIKERKINIQWGCQARADTISRYSLEELKQIKTLGCDRIAIGAESGNQRVLNLLKCNTTTVEQNHKAIQLLYEAGIQSNVTFIIGTPSETKEEMMETFNFIMNNKIMTGGYAIAIPYPGTVLYKIAREKGLLPEKIDYSKYQPDMKPEDGNIICDTMSKKEFIKLYNKLSIKVNKHTTYNRMMFNKNSLGTNLKKALIQYPKETLLYPIQHPIKSFKLLTNVRW